MPSAGVRGVRRCDPASGCSRHTAQNRFPPVPRDGGADDAGSTTGCGRTTCWSVGRTSPSTSTPRAGCRWSSAAGRPWWASRPSTSCGASRGRLPSRSCSGVGSRGPGLDGRVQRLVDAAPRRGRRPRRSGARTRARGLPGALRLAVRAGPDAARRRPDAGVPSGDRRGGSSRGRGRRHRHRHGGAGAGGGAGRGASGLRRRGRCGRRRGGRPVRGQRRRRPRRARARVVDRGGPAGAGRRRGERDHRERAPQRARPGDLPRRPTAARPARRQVRPGGWTCTPPATRCRPPGRSPSRRRRSPRGPPRTTPTSRRCCAGRVVRAAAGRSPPETSSSGCPSRTPRGWSRST